MFDTEIESFNNWFCEKTSFKKLSKTWDDTCQAAAFLTKKSEDIETELSETGGWIIARRPIRVYVQYKNVTIQKIAGIFIGSDYTLQSINDDSGQIYKQLTGNDLVQNREFKFMALTVELKQIIVMTKCLPPC